MTEINLLPWRETLREAVKKEWLLLLFMVLVLAMVILVITCTVLNAKIRHITQMNNELRHKISALSDDLLCIKAIQRQQSDVAAKAVAFKFLQEERMSVASVLAQVVSQMPSGVYLTVLYKKNQQWTLEGVAKSPSQVSTFMQGLAQLPLLAAPQLMQITTKDNKAHHFEINLNENLRQEGVYGSE